jgi:hypothetical protein
MSDFNDLRVPAWCPICDLVMRETKVYFKWRCCNLCYIEFIEHREQRWTDGWRPSADEIASFLKTMNI